MKTFSSYFTRTQTCCLFTVVLLLIGTFRLSAHCDSYGGPVIKDAIRALQKNKVSLVYKWISTQDEPEIATLFATTYKLRNGDKDIYNIVEKHFFETLVRLHRATEQEPYTGLKPTGSIEPVIKMSDEAIETGNIDDLLTKLNAHITKSIKEKYQKMKTLELTKDTSPDSGRKYVHAYVDYIHTIAKIHNVVEGSAKKDCSTSKDSSREENGC